jgi:hypothetical protein
LEVDGDGGIGLQISLFECQLHDIKVAA